ncbi:MAG: serine/threonine-protein phosphatase [Deltaproteobacteria bacterium]|nr:serine/threonine-protein phosphatase [Deltaproteobacteria bacterium]
MEFKGPPATLSDVNKRLSALIRGKDIRSRFKQKTGSYVQVRGEKELPELALKFCRFHPQTHQPLSREDTILFAQVLMHEIDEGVRVLSHYGQEEEAKIINNFKNSLHILQRLALLREQLDKLASKSYRPEAVSHVHKIRNNQWGVVQEKLGKHDVYAVTDSGIGYKNVNEDAILVLPQQKTVAVVDGMGGHLGGNIASCVAIDFFEFALEKGLDLAEAISFANDAILARSELDSRLGGRTPMGCTFAAVRFLDSKIEVAHVGDTKVLLVRKKKIIYQSQDHTQGQYLLSEGLVDCATAFELNHILSRCLGLDKMQAQRDVSYSIVPCKSGDRIVMMTDGITDNFFDKKFQLINIANAVMKGSLSTVADRLIDTYHNLMLSKQLPNGRSPKADNISLAFLQC